ncbi:MAG: tRNA 2-thiouridine(34) synthase MnmA [Candidatus Moranbacteria bacterium]|nr:tRNA 2-thiouridine(34) synthase MnmA [Candidatus Moranbacteria bacterium]
MDKKNPKVLIALSGGVDSAVAAALLKKQGFDTAGVFFVFGPWGEKTADVRNIAKKIGIPLEVIDARKQFREKIIDYFIESYKKNITPNPCIVCNKEMKFGLMFELLKKHKADFIATGHYAKKVKIFKKSFYKLCESYDKQKDQSYFLHKLTQKQLAKIIFPLGELEKREVKKIAKKMHIPVDANKESMDVCFLQGIGINDYLKKYLKAKPGNIVDEEGNILGKHRGLPFYTFGQRKGLAIGGEGPYFVVGKNSRRNELVVSNNPKKLLKKSFFLAEANWIRPDLKFPLRARAQVRYHTEKIPAIIKKTEKNFEVVGEKNFPAPTPGQSAVFFNKDEVLGGGVIQE